MFKTSSLVLSLSLNLYTPQAQNIDAKQYVDFSVNQPNYKNTLEFNTISTEEYTKDTVIRTLRVMTESISNE